MSAAASGNESWMWTAFLRMAEPLMQLADIDDEPETDRMLGLAIGRSACIAGEEDAERWDGMS